MKKTLFSKGLYFEALRRIRIFSIIILAIAVIQTVSPFLMILSSNVFNPSATATPINSTVITSSLYLVITVEAFVATLIVFCQFNSRKYCDFYHALPYTRECIFFSFLSAILTVIIATGVIITVLGIVLYGSFPTLFILNLSNLFARLLTMFAGALFVISVVSLACSITGRTFAGICTAAMIGLFPRFVFAAISYATAACSNLITIVPLSTFFSPQFNALVYSVASSFNDDKLSFIPAVYTICLSLVYFAAATVCYKLRKSENASKPSANKWIQSVVRIVLGSVLSIIGTLLIVVAVWYKDTDVISFVIAFAIILYLISIVIYLAYELITTRKWIKVAKALPGLGIVVLVNVLCATAVYIGVFASTSYQPTADEVSSIKYYSDGEDGFLADLFMPLYNDINGGCFSKAAEKVEIKDKKTIEIVTSVLKNNIESEKANKNNVSYNYTGICKTLTFAIKEGIITRYRTITFTDAEYKAYTTALSEYKEYTDAYMNLPKPVDNTFYTDAISVDDYEANVLSTGIDNGAPLAKEEVADLLNTLQDEINEMGFVKWYSYLNDIGEYNPYLSSSYYPMNTLYITYTADDISNSTVRIDIDGTVLPKTYTKLLHLNYKYTIDEAVKMLKEIKDSDNLNEMLNKKDLTLTVTVCDGEYINDRYFYYEPRLTLEAANELYKLATSGDENSLTASKFVKIRMEYFNNDLDSSDILGIDYYSYYHHLTAYLPVPDGYDLSALKSIIETDDYDEYSDDIVTVQVSDDTIVY